MVFNWTLTKPVTTQEAEGVSVSTAGVTVEFETGSFAEAKGILENEESVIREIFGDVLSRVDFTETKSAGEASEKPARKPRTPKVEAVAPPPMAVPAVVAVNAGPVITVAAPPVPPALVATATTLPPNAMTIPDDGGIPAGLRRDASNQAPALAVAPPPPAAVAPPLPTLPSPPIVPTSPPPVGVLGPKVVKALDLLKEGKPDGGKSLADWLHAAGLTQKDAAYDDACRALLMISDEKLKGVAERLGV